MGLPDLGKTQAGRCTDRAGKDGAEVIDRLMPFYRLGEYSPVVVAGPEKRTYYLVIQELPDGWDITQERPGYYPSSDVAL